MGTYKIEIDTGAEVLTYTKQMTGPNLLRLKAYLTEQFGNREDENGDPIVPTNADLMEMMSSGVFGTMNARIKQFEADQAVVTDPLED